MSYSLAPSCLVPLQGVRVPRVNNIQPLGVVKVVPVTVVNNLQAHLSTVK